MLILIADGRTYTYDSSTGDKPGFVRDKHGNLVPDRVVVEAGSLRVLSVLRGRVVAERDEP